MMERGGDHLSTYHWVHFEPRYIILTPGSELAQFLGPQRFVSQRVKTNLISRVRNFGLSYDCLSGIDP